MVISPLILSNSIFPTLSYERHGLYVSPNNYNAYREITDRPPVGAFFATYGISK